MGLIFMVVFVLHQAWLYIVWCLDMLVFIASDKMSSDFYILFCTKTFFVDSHWNHLGDSNEYSQEMVWCKNNKNNKENDPKLSLQLSPYLEP